jgi:3-(3-hydroxy-phenyl)propionate hydroxylase
MLLQYLQPEVVMYFQPESYAHVPLPAGSGPHSVVVVGAGPVGLATALGLAQRGVRVLVLEAGDSVSFGSRAICLSRNSLQILDRLGVGDRFVELSLPWTRGRSFYRDDEVLVFDMPAAEEYARPPMVNISQSVAEQILVDRVAAEPNISLHWQTRFVGCRRDGDLVSVEVETPDGTQQLQAQWLVAADGARSNVRDALGLSLSGTSYEGRYVIADIHWPTDRPTERLVWFDPASNPGATIIMHRQPDDIWRVDYQLGPQDDAEAEVRPERVRERIARHLDWIGSTVPWSIEWVSLYRAHALSLDEYRHGRVLFAGDSAHLVPIFGVRGLNSGFEDADDLAWKLALVVSGSASEALLDTYSQERRAAWQQNVDNAEKSTLFMTPGSHGYEQTREAALSLVSKRPVFANLVNPRQSSATNARASALTVPAAAAPGVPGVAGAVPGDVVDDRVVTVLGDSGISSSTLRAVVGTGFGLVGVGVDPAVVEGAAKQVQDRLGEAVEARAVLVTHADGPSGSVVAQISDPYDEVAASLGASKGDVVVLRPDGRVLARVPETDDVAAVLDVVFTGTPRPAPAGLGREPVEPAEGDRAGEVRLVETAWQAVSGLLDSTPPEDRERVLVRLAMLLALDTGRTEAVDRAVDVVSEVIGRSVKAPTPA